MQSGSEARDHLANERTYLAWLRTAFGTAAVGIVLARLHISDTENEKSGPRQTLTKVISFMFVLIGTFCVITGSSRYARVQSAMQTGKYPTAGSLTIIITISSIIVLLLTLVLLMLSLISNNII